ncbi:MAG TPA: endonuclease/exonuclease/phosphatase family protein [Bacteroidales bacterium]|nr:endonuclease/exonuclease/phosphatase family protein [Bacteroidales bacterium]
MSQKIKIATYNCENLFSRSRIFKEDDPKARKLLEAVEKLEEELKKPVFDQAEISSLKAQLKGYATIIDVREKHTKKGTGSKNWVGWIEFEMEPADTKSVRNLAKVISEIDADIICLIEVENRTLLQRFHDEILYRDFLKPIGKLPYKHIMLIDGNDPRGIDVSLMSRHPIMNMKSYIDDTTDYLGKTVKTFSRDCLHIQLDIKAVKPLNIFINHLKSQGYSGGQDPGGDIRRKGQAKRVAEIINELDLKNDYIIVAGDMNSDHSSDSLAPLIMNDELHNLNLMLPENERGTYGTGKEQLDYLIVTEPLKARCRNLQINRSGIYTKPGVGGISNITEAASDHAAVVAEFDF